MRSLQEQLREAKDEMIQLRRQASIRRRQSSADKALKEENEQLRKEIDQLQSVRPGGSACASEADLRLSVTRSCSPTNTLRGKAVRTKKLPQSLPHCTHSWTRPIAYSFSELWQLSEGV